MKDKAGGLNGFTLKMIAITSMLIDHIGAVLLTQYTVLRMIGRLAFPIYCFLLVEGFSHTRNVRKYELRLLLFAFISELPFDLAFHGTLWYPAYQNVFFTLALGILALDLFERMEERHMRVLGIVLVLACVAAAELLNTDYGGGGVLIIYFMYLFREYPIQKYISLAILSWVFFGWLECVCLVAIFPLLLYNGRKGPSAKYVFYAFYPVHLFVLYLIWSIQIFGTVRIPL